MGTSPSFEGCSRIMSMTWGEEADELGHDVEDDQDGLTFSAFCQ
jgi:hypothetical protein